MRRAAGWLAIVLTAALAANPASSASPAASPIASPSPSSAADPSSSPGVGLVALGSPCELWTVEEVSAALGGGEFTIEQPSPGVPTCGYLGTKKAGDLTQGLSVGLTFGDASTGALDELIRQSYPDSTELDIGGVVAIPGTTYPGAGKAKGWSASTLFVLPNPMTLLALQAVTPKGVDAAAALVSLAELAAPRIATIGPPAASPSPSVVPGASGIPTPSGEVRTGLAALFPTEVGGSPVSIDVALTGKEFLAQVINFQSMEQRVSKALKQKGKKIGDLSFVSGGTKSGSVIVALQVKDAAIKPFVKVLLESLAMERTGQAASPGDVAGKAAFGINGGFLIGGQGYAYPKDDVLWFVFSFAPEVTEIFEKLP